MKTAGAASYEVSLNHYDRPTINMVVKIDETELNLILPQAEGLRYYFLPKKGVKSFAVGGAGTTISELGMTETARQRFMNGIVYKSHRKIQFGDFVLGVGGPYPARRIFYDTVRMLRGVRGKIDTRYLTIRELFEGWSFETTPAVVEKTLSPVGSRAVVVCHMYYMEALEEIAALIASRRQRLDVIVTLPSEREEWRDRIVELIPGAKVKIFENMGRDVRPFLKVLEAGLLDHYDLVCKIHGKVSRGGGRKHAAGELWRRHLFYDLLGDQKALDLTFERFAADRTVGMIGPAAYRCPGPIFDEAAGWSVNRARILDLAARMGLTEADHRLDFFAGTMFWVRLTALTPLRGLALADSYFEPECGSLDGGPEHAVERAFGTSVAVAGLRMEDVVTTASHFMRKSGREPMIRK